jgi:hypothetical protein
MVCRFVILICAVTVSLGGLSCRPLPSGTAPKHLLKIEPTSIEAIPSQYGNLVSVTQQDPNVALLWFERPDKTIVIVGLNLQGRNVSLAENVVLVPRSPQ